MSADGRRPDLDDTQPLPEVHPSEEEETARHISYDGLGLISRLRLRHAGRVIEKMEHKDRLYDDLAEIAVSGKRSAPDKEKPRTLPEQLVDYRLQRKSDKKARADVYAYRAMTIHGPDAAPYVPSVRHGLTESALGVATDRDREYSLGETLWGNIKRLFEGPHIAGYTPLKRKIEKAKIIGHVAVKDVTAAEARQKWLKTNAEKMKLGNKTHKHTRRQQRKHNERVRLAAEQPLLSRWRYARHQRALETIDRLQQ